MENIMNKRLGIDGKPMCSSIWEDIIEYNLLVIAHGSL